MIRLLRKLAITGILLGYVGLGIIAIWGSKATLSPPRRSIEDWHRKILEAPAVHGMEVSQQTDAKGTPYMICEPSSVPQGEKSMTLRQELQQRGVAIAPWGTIRGTILLLHGHKGCKEDHLPICERFCAAGFRCLCIDLPGHGQNPASYATFGLTEVSMLQNLWSEFLTLHPQAQGPLFLFGVSQGGAIALQSAANPNWHIQAVASVCAFTSLTQPIDASADYLPSMIRDLKPLTTRACAMGIYCRSGFFPDQISPLQSAKHISCPVFLCHGTNDGFIPMQSVEKLYQAVPHSHKTMKMIEGAKHGNVLSVGSTTLYADICEFFLKAL